MNDSYTPFMGVIVCNGGRWTTNETTRTTPGERARKTRRLGSRGVKRGSSVGIVRRGSAGSDHTRSQVVGFTRLARLPVSAALKLNQLHTYIVTLEVNNQQMKR